MSEGMQEGSWEEQKKKLEKNPDFHMDQKRDAVEMMIEQLGWEGALEQISENLDANPSDEEARRQANLIATLLGDKLQTLKDKLNH